MHPYHRLAELIEDWQFLIRQDGIRSSLPTVAREIAWLPYRHLEFVILARSLSEPLPEMQPKILLEIHPFQARHLELVQAIDRPSEARLCKRRLEASQHGLVAFHQGQIAGYAWGCTYIDRELERVHLQLEPGDILCTDVYTSPLLRGKGVQTALTLRRFQLFRELGYRRAICYIEVNNTPSLAVWQRKFSAETVGRINFKRIGPWYRVHYNYNLTSIEQTDLADKHNSQSKSMMVGSE